MRTLVGINEEEEEGKKVYRLPKDLGKVGKVLYHISEFLQERMD